MSVEVFIDSNIWLYALIKDSTSNKSERAGTFIRNQQSIACSVQVLNEICANLKRKAGKDNQHILQFTQDFIAAYTVYPQTPQDLQTAATLRLDYNISYWDSLIIANALNNGGTTVYSEDMQHDLKIYDQLTILNPLLLYDE